MRMASIYTDTRCVFSQWAPPEWTRSVVEYEYRKPVASLDEANACMTMPFIALQRAHVSLKPVVNVCLGKVELGV
jgi:hypothetical protein